MLGGLPRAKALLVAGGPLIPGATVFKFTGRGRGMNPLTRAVRETATAQLPGASGIIAPPEVPPQSTRP
jgi:hypothetical protein